MKLHRTEHGCTIWLSARETAAWASRPGSSWPCSFLSGRRLFAELESNGDLVDLSIDGGRGDQDCPANELGAILDDHGAHAIKGTDA